MPSKPTQNGYLSNDLRVTLRKATVKDHQERQRGTNYPDGELLRVLLDVCVEHFGDDERQATCALRRYLVLRYRWTEDTISQQLAAVEVLRLAGAVS